MAVDNHPVAASWVPKKMLLPSKKAFEAMVLNELAATAAARPRTTPRGLVANAAANNAAVAVAVAITQGTRPAGTGKT